MSFGIDLAKLTITGVATGRALRGHVPDPDAAVASFERPFRLFARDETRNRAATASKDMTSTPITSPVYIEPRVERVGDRPASLPLECYGATALGLQRRVNEDHFAVALLERSLEVSTTSLEALPQARREAALLLAVADGMGGHAAGRTASRIAVQAAIELVAGVAFQRDGRRLCELLSQCFAEAERRLREDAQVHPDREHMGTTLTLALVRWPRLYLAHAGDSRCYLLRDSRLEQLTRDHTFATQLIERGVIDAEAASRSPMKNVLVNALGGNAEDVRTDTSMHDLQEGDVLMLCTDGVSGQVAEDRIAQILLSAGDPRSAGERLVAAADEAGGVDNATAIVGMRIGPEDRTH
jgi:protein phosphatase